MKDIAGQISLTDLLDFMSPQIKKTEAPIMLLEDQKVYKVIRGDVEEHIVTGETWTCGENNRGYRLKRISGCWDVVWNTSIGVSVFTDLSEANKKAEQYISQNECIRAEDIKSKDVVAYRYVYNGMEKTNFYAVLNDGMIYYHYGSMYEHIGTMKEIKDFEKDMYEMQKHDGFGQIRDYHPAFANMYKCNGGQWKYAAARYQYING